MALMVDDEDLEEAAAAVAKLKIGEVKMGGNHATAKFGGQEVPLVRENGRWHLAEWPE